MDYSTIKDGNGVDLAGLPNNKDIWDLFGKWISCSILVFWQQLYKGRLNFITPNQEY